jgi:hypothetical protein
VTAETRRRCFTGVTCKRVPGLGFECGLHWEIAGITGNRSRGSGAGGNGRGRRPAVRGGAGSMARSRGRGKEGGKRENGWQASLPRCGAFAAAGGGEEAVERRCDVRPKLGNGVRWRSSGRLGFYGGRRRLRLGDRC